MATTSLGFSIFSTYNPSGTNAAAKGLAQVGNVARDVAKLAGAALTVAGGFAAVWTANAVRAGIASNELQQRAGAALELMLGSAEAASEQIEKLRAFGSESPISLSVWIRAQQQMLAFGVETQKVIPLLEAIQNTVLAGGGTEMEIERVIEVMSRMSSSAEVTKGDLNVLGTQGVAAAELVGSAFGKTSAQIVQEISDGSFAVDDFYEGFITGADTAFGGVAESVRETFVGVIDRLRGVQRRIGEILVTPFINPAGGGAFIELGNAVADMLNNVEDAIRPLAADFSADLAPKVRQASAAIREFGESITTEKVREFVDSLRPIAPIVTAAGTAFATGFVGKIATSIPVLGAVTAKISPLATGIAALAVASPELRDALVSVFTAVQPLVPVVADLAEIVANVLAAAIHTVAPLLQFIAENLKIIGPAAVIAAAGMAAYGLASTAAGTASIALAIGVLRIRDAIVAMTVAMLANPLLLGTLAIGTALVALTGFDSTVKDVTQDVQALGSSIQASLTTALTSSRDLTEEASDELREFISGYQEAEQQFADLNHQNPFEWLNTSIDATANAEANLDKYRSQVSELDQTLAGLVESGTSQAEIFRTLKDDFGLTGDQIGFLLPKLENYQLALDAAAAETHAAEVAQAELAAAIGSATVALIEQAEVLRAQSDPLFALVKAEQDLKTAQDNVNAAVQEYGVDSEEARAASLDAALALLDYTDAGAAAASVMGQNLSPEFIAAAAAAGFTDEVVGLLTGQVEGATGAFEDFADDYQANVKVKGVDSVISAAERVKKQLAGIQRQVNISFTTSGFLPRGGVKIPTFATGGQIQGFGTETSDSNLIAVSDNEYIVRAAAVNKYGTGIFNALNSLRVPAFANGGSITTSSRSSTRGISLGQTSAGGVTLVFNGPVTSKRQAEDLVISAIKSAQDKGRIPKLIKT